MDSFFYCEINSCPLEDIQKNVEKQSKKKKKKLPVIKPLLIF